MLVATVLAALTAASPAVPSPGAPPLRLPATVRPLAGTLELRVDPEEASHSGTARYRVSVTEPSPVVWMHSEGLSITSAKVGGRPARAITAPGGFLGLQPDEPVPAGETELEVSFTGSVDRTRSRGLYAVAEGGAWYAYTFFEPIDARRAFPCFDEPSAKIPWTLALMVPAADVALANTPVSSEMAEGRWKRVTFATTRPLPSYLVAFVVGPFDVISGGAGGAARVPIRFVVPRGRGAELHYALSVTPRILDALEAVVGLPYPYEKCDVAVVPRYWGTMEHPGLVAMGQPLSLIPPAEETRDRREHYANIAIHELAHHWYGDLVTTAWWDDIWLNESFATWDDANVTERLEPSWRALETGRWSRRSSAISGDVLASARRVREPVVSPNEIEGAFDAQITYYKGASLLEAYDRFLGGSTFRETVRAFLAARADRTATSDDLLAVLAERAGPAVADSLRGFLDRPGVPLLRVSRRCGPAGAAAVVRQERFISSGKRDPGAAWTVPVCVRAGSGKRVATACALVGGPEGEVPLPFCPDWIWPNDGGRGYHLSLFPGSTPARLLPRLTAPEILTLATDATVLGRRGDLPIADALALVVPLAGSPDRLQIQASLDILALVDWKRLPERELPAFAALVRRAYGAHARALGWSTRPGDSEEEQALRRLLVPLVARLAGDAVLEREARRLADRFLSGADPAMEDTTWAAMGVAARVGDRALFDRIATAATSTPELARKEELYPLLGLFEDPALSREALAMIVAPGSDLRDTLSVLERALPGRRTGPGAWSFLQEGWDELTPRMRNDEIAWLVAAAAREACDPNRRAAVEAFLGPRVAAFDGAPQSLRVGLEEADACIAARARNGEAISKFLRRR
jgi:hypothetical protein